MTFRDKFTASFELLRRLLFLVRSCGFGKAAWILGVMILQGILQVAGVTSIFPFLALAMNPEGFRTSGIGQRILALFPPLDNGQVLLWASVLSIATLCLGNLITLHGDVDDLRKLETMRGAGVFAQHSVTSSSGDQEGLPLAILEALALGIPVVSTLHSGIPEVVEEGVNGFLVREWDFEAIADRIIHVLQSGFRPQLSAREKILSLDQRVERIEAVLAGALPLTRQLAANR